MTMDMAFECLLVSKDPGVVNTMTRLLANLAIHTTVCPNSAGAFNQLSHSGMDLLIIDLQRDSQEFLRSVNQTKRPRRPPVIAVSDLPASVPGDCALLLKPIKAELGAQLLWQTYSKLLDDYRQHARVALMKRLVATNQYSRSVNINLVNIGAGGVGLSTDEFLSRGDLVSFSLVLPGQEIPIDIEARVLWRREYGAVGCEYTALSQDDRRRLQDWLEQKCQVKAPLIGKDDRAN